MIKINKFNVALKIGDDNSQEEKEFMNEIEDAEKSLMEFMTDNLLKSIG